MMEPHPSLEAYYVELTSPSQGSSSPKPTPTETHFDFYPTRYTIGPWSLDAQHGNALMLHCMRRVADASFAPNPAPALTPTRLTVNLYRPVTAVRPIRITVTSLLTSRSVRHLAASVAPRPDVPSSSTSSSTTTVGPSATAEALFHVPLPTGPDPSLAAAAARGAAADIDALDPPPRWNPTAADLDRELAAADPAKAPPRVPGAPIRFFNSIATVFDARDGGRTGWIDVPVGEDQDPFVGATMWVRARPGLAFIVPDPSSAAAAAASAEAATVVPVTPLHLLVMAGDAGSGISSAIPWGKFSYSNISVNYFWLREPSWDGPAAPWLVMRARTRYQSQGAALAVSLFRDASRAPCAYVLQNLVVKPMAAAAGGAKTKAKV
ncbi:hypothetical protein DFJ73DRAFT_797942 [Zopfochytrium polystomum]|nr:hypothetical protein DFJ73DRAFT_797942 [Zopfochytrium polystomum]